MKFYCITIWLGYFLAVSNTVKLAKCSVLLWVRSVFVSLFELEENSRHWKQTLVAKCTLNMCRFVLDSLSDIEYRAPVISPAVLLSLVGNRSSCWLARKYGQC